MSEQYDYGKRADDLADTMRRYLVGINTGGIAVTLTFAASMAEKGIHPAWAIVPVSLFAFGLGVSGFSLLYAKHKALKRKDAKEEGKEIPKFKAWCQRNFTYELITLVIFLVASGASIYQLKNLELMQPEVEKHEKPLTSEKPNQPLKKDLGDAARPSAS
jgi:hypothetical protein